MTALVVYPSTAQETVGSFDAATYATAADGGGAYLWTPAVSANPLPVGQEKSGASYATYEQFVDFDASSIPDDATIDSATLELYAQSLAGGVTAFTLQARVYDWGATVTTGDYRTRAQLTALTVAASIAHASLSTSAYVALTETSTNLRDAISKTGVTRFVLCSSRHAAGTTPTTAEYIYLYSQGETGTTKDPKLTVNYTPAGFARDRVVTPRGLMRGLA